jgi:large subunit ribosomal protein L9
VKVKVVLLADIKGVGKKGEIVEVSRGYADNYLLPKKLARIATEDVIKTIKELEEVKKRKLEKERQRALNLASKLKATRLVIKKKAGESGKLFGSITPKEIADALKSATGESIDKKSIVIDVPIKTLGEFKITVELGFGIKTDLILEVKPE